MTKQQDTALAGIVAQDILKLMSPSEEVDRPRCAQNILTFINALRDEVARLRDFEKHREGCHETYNGGFRGHEAKAFHAGMDTVFNRFENYSGATS